MNGREASMLRAVRGPIILITVGVLFALNNFTQYRFDQTWPVIRSCSDCSRCCGAANTGICGTSRNRGRPKPASAALTARASIQGRRPRLRRPRWMPVR